ncbi:hypothetical protein GGE07_006543 [Sinorhizobium terangae]|nr:hypothetical protein [Sinorhizobium terangae]MBB4189837.1 hypothetical protein [Sinorhizobium terangae]
MVEHGEDVAEVIVRRRPIGEGPKAPQQSQPLLAKTRDIGEGLGSRQHREQAQEQDLLERIDDLARLPMVRQVLEKTKEKPSSPPAQPDPLPSRPSFHPLPNQRMSTDSAQSRLVTYFFTRLP